MAKFLVLSVPDVACHVILMSFFPISFENFGKTFMGRVKMLVYRQFRGQASLENTQRMILL